jgi:aminopeptidase N
MDQDALVSARAIRQPVTSTSEAMEAFDGITYQKGAALLAMLEGWLGKDTFQAGVRDYLTLNAFKNARAEDLLASLDKVSRKDVTGMAATYLDRPGVPMITAHLSCGTNLRHGGGWNVELIQEPWRPLGSTAEPSQQAWTTPVCLRVEGREEPSCVLMASGVPSLVGGSGACPAWVFPNADAVGYFRFAESAQELMPLVRAASTSLDGPSRLSILSNVWAMVRSGALAPDQVFKILPQFDKDDERLVVEEEVSILSQMSDVLVEDDTRPQFRAFVLERLARHKKKLVGWAPDPQKTPPATPRARDPGDDQALLQRSVLFAMADLAEDPATLKEAEPFARGWLREPASVDADIAAIAVELASRKAGLDRLEALRAAAKRAKEPQERILALRGMFAFEDPQVLERALDLVLTDEIRLAETRYVFGTASRRTTKKTLLKWVEAHWDGLRQKMPGSLAGGLVSAAGLVCTKAERDDVRAFFTPRAKNLEGASRPLAESLEYASLCAELRERGGPAVTKALTKKK